MEKEKHVDESWKDSVAQEKQNPPELSGQEQQDPQEQADAAGAHPMEVNFINYISSLVFQTMIFIGELPNPITNEIDKNLDQAKFLIDTLVMLRDKTKGNLSKPEEDLLNSAVYELQMRYVDIVSKENPQGGR